MAIIINTVSYMYHDYGSIKKKMRLKLHDGGRGRITKVKCFQYLGCCNLSKHCRSHIPFVVVSIIIPLFT